MKLGWELYISVEFAESVYQDLATAGKVFDLTHVGHYALDACRLEKGFRHWGHDIGPDDTPLQAGLSFAVAWDKPSGFIGQDALLRQRDGHVDRRLMSFAVKGSHPLLLHDEPIYRDGSLVGRTTSGGRGFRTGLTLCMGYVECEPGTSRASLLDAIYRVAVAGEIYDIEPLGKPAYDPSGSRMRS